MRKVFPIACALALPLSAQLRITEVMSDSGHDDTRANGDWFEITNTGSSTVSLAGYSFDDDSADIGASGPFPPISLAPGASMIVLNESFTNALTFRTLWNIDPSVVILSNSQISNFPGLGGGGDELYLFNGTNSNSSIVDSYLFGPATEGVSFARFNNGQVVPGGLSANGIFGAYESDDSSADIASPGISANPPEPLPPFFTEPFNTAALAGADIGTSDFRVRSFDPNPGDTITLTLSGAPAWLGITPLGNGIGRFTGTPPAGVFGPVTFDVVATDNTARSTSQEYRIEILPSTSPIILNEYNGVSPDQFLDGGAAGDLGASSDPFFGRIEGNGGAWVEFVVTQTLDLRNWTLRIVSDDGLRELKFSDHISLASIPAGTILTLTEGKQITPTRFNSMSALDTTGMAWTNIWMHDPILIDQTTSTHPVSPAIGSNNTLVTWLDESSNVVYGPAGESIAVRDTNGNTIGDELIGVSGTEVFKLETNPSSSTTPLNINHDDGGTSTFGAPNRWSNNTLVQNFSSFVAASTPPSFGEVPQTKAARGAYDVSITSPGGTIAVLAAPDFLTIDTSGATIDITNNRPLTVSDIGSYEITIQADSGAAPNNLGYLVYELEVLHPAPAVILNEYNAVADDRFLNGGTAGLDSDGAPNAADTHFGRVLGNGGNWFELAVVGNDGPGFTDLTDWTIEVGFIASSGKFVNQSTITLSNAATWSSVAHGTLLTFTERNTAGGGLDTDLNRVNNLATLGYAWSNIHLNTPGAVTLANPDQFRINSSNTAFVIKDDEGTVIFGPAGEGVAPPDGVGSTEIFELENDPTSMVSPIDDASPTSLGYDDGSSSSTFGSPNLFSPIGSMVDQAQDFSIFIPATSAFDDFMTDNGLPGALPGEDADSDGHSNLDEYLFGSLPGDSNSAPFMDLDPATGTLTMNVRVNDPLYPIVGQRSLDLQNWVTTEITTSDDTSALGSDFVLRSVSYTGNEPRTFLRFATTSP
ncbi:MAG: lamin tail domain-containing protein [Akkermansiaceae bacterium]